MIRAFSLAMAAITTGGLGSLTYATKLEPAWFETVELNLTLSRLPEVFQGYRIVQISDFHMEWMGQERLFDIVGRVNRLRPDLIVMTGDYVTRTYSRAAEDLIPPLRALHAPDGVVGVLGNHDYWGHHGPAIIRRVLHESHSIDLNNNIYTVERGGQELHIAGVDSVREGQDRLDKVVQNLPNRGGSILLVHEPDFADKAARTGRFDLQISGHSHGGQVVVPFVGPPHLPPMGKKYHTGLYKVGNMLQYTNRGLGMVGLPVRFCCRPEITVFNLHAARSNGSLARRVQ